MSTPIDQALSADLLKQILQLVLTLPAEKLPALREYLLFFAGKHEWFAPSERPSC